jgi:glutathione S-transferase
MMNHDQDAPERDHRAQNQGHSHQHFGQVPWLTDGELSIFESGAILLYVGERSEALMPADPRGRKAHADQMAHSAAADTA